MFFRFLFYGCFSSNFNYVKLGFFFLFFVFDLLFKERAYQFGKGEDSLEDKVHSSLIPSIKNLFEAEIQHKDILLKKNKNLYC